MHLEIDVIPVSDVDRAKQLYQSPGWRLDDDAPANDVRIVQYTPPRVGRRRADRHHIEMAHGELIGLGIDASDMWHGAPFPRRHGRAVPTPHTSYGSFFSLNDPDGIAWLVQEVTTRLPGRV
jgi:catechol 2,3-dioxygenase-like lactoylglutathione lyase family enzyme